MIIGIGVDTVSVARMEKALSRPPFKEHTFTPGEIEACHGDEPTYYAARFACKEAVFKALGSPKDWRQVETLHDGDGKPFVVMRPEWSGLRVHISVTTEAGAATAFCVAEQELPEKE